MGETKKLTRTVTGLMRPGEDWDVLGRKTSSCKNHNQPLSTLAVDHLFAGHSLYRGFWCSVAVGSPEVGFA